MVVALELIFTSKRSLSNDTPQSNIKPLGSYAVPGIRNPEQTINGWTWAYLSCTQK